MSLLACTLTILWLFGVSAPKYGRLFCGNNWGRQVSYQKAVFNHVVMNCCLLILATPYQFHMTNQIKATPSLFHLTNQFNDCFVLV